MNLNCQSVHAHKSIFYSHPAKLRFSRSTGLIAGLLLGLAGSAQATTDDQVYEVRSESSHAKITIGGTVVPLQEVTLAAQLPGRVSEITGKEGDAIKEGELIVQIDDTSLLAQRKEAVAAIYGAEAAAQNAQMQYSRELVSPQSDRASTMPGMGVPGMFDQMFSRPMASMMDMEDPNMQRSADLSQQGAQLNQARSSVSQAEARIEQIDAKIRDSRSIAPVEGVIARKMVEVGDTVQPGQALVVFTNIHHLQIKADVPVRLGHRLKTGDMVKANLDVGSQMMDVKVAQIFPVADEKRHTITVKFDLPEGVSAASGMYANVMLPDPDKSGDGILMVPRAALLWRGSMPGVMVVNAEGESSLRLLRIKYGTKGEWVQVYAGLENGEKIIVPQTKLQ